jgi:trans-aconitate 2-methyltransferase
MKWDPRRYDAFKAQRRLPFEALAGMVRPKAGMRVVDLGCGTGELTAWLHAELGASETLGVDASAEMLAGAPGGVDGLRFELGDIHAFEPDGAYDLIFANAALQWVPEPEAVLARLLEGLPRGGQIAVQVPVQDDHPSHAVAAEVARRPRYAEALGGWVRRTNALDLRTYATLLDAHGMTEIDASVRVFGHHLRGRDALFDWVDGSLLRAYRARLEPEVFEAFVADYRAELAARLPDTSPFYYPFTRLLFHAVRA